jgi:hypothetical protein
LLLCWTMWRIWPCKLPANRKGWPANPGRKREEAVKHLKHNKASGEDLLQIGSKVLEDLLLAWCSSDSRKKCRTNGQLASSVWSDYKKSDTCNSCKLFVIDVIWAVITTKEYIVSCKQNLTFV